ncbi:NUDIX hydrolase [Dyella sp. EPa41]|uniref:NUDIX hydrolase n=1 Tax=Dyella sp. EPa41 TaxID=1561194 RepID=UPI00191602DC|nr:NUDIX hydrolase [Dyella sp. EPa41]
MHRLTEQFQQYGRRWPEEKDVSHFIELLDGGEHRFRRESVEAHFTGSAWLVSADNERVLLTHHRKLGRWLQLGGHADGDVDLARVALREAEEESGIVGLSVEPAPFDLDRHRIPARGAEPEHWHYDVRYVVRAGASEAFVVSEESHALAWRPIRQIADDPQSDESLRRMAWKWLQR